MNEYLKLSAVAKITHEKMSVLIDLQTEIMDNDYTNISDIFRTINTKLDYLLIDSKTVFNAMQNIVNEGKTKWAI